MKKLEALNLIYWLAMEADLEGAVRALEPQQLSGLHRWLAEWNHTGGFPRLLRGLIEAEAATRHLEGGAK